MLLTQTEADLTFVIQDRNWLSSNKGRTFGKKWPARAYSKISGHRGDRKRTTSLLIVMIILRRSETTLNAVCLYFCNSLVVSEGRGYILLSPNPSFCCGLLPEGARPL